MTQVSWELIIFDCDGVLVDSEPIANRILTRMLNELGLPISYEETLRSFVGRSMLSCVQIIEERLGRRLPADFVRTYNARSFAAFEEELQTMPGVTEALQRIRMPVCVASSACRLNCHATTLAIAARPASTSAAPTAISNHSGAKIAVAVPAAAATARKNSVSMITPSIM